jgi:hypothetical protein
MKAADIAAIVVFVLLAAGGVGAFYYYQDKTAREEAAAYEAALDGVIDRKIDAVNLDFLAAELAPHGDARVDALQALYADPERNIQINLGFGTLRGDFPASYALVAEGHGREVEPGRLQREVDERYGAGAYELMAANYSQFLVEAPQRAAERDAARQRRMDESIRALDRYAREHGGRHPEGAFRVENGRVIEE